MKKKEVNEIEKILIPKEVSKFFENCFNDKTNAICNVFMPIRPNKYMNDIGVVIRTQTCSIVFFPYTTEKSHTKILNKFKTF